MLLSSGFLSFPWKSVLLFLFFGQDVISPKDISSAAVPSTDDIMCSVYYIWKNVKVKCPVYLSVDKMSVDEMSVE